MKIVVDATSLLLPSAGVKTYLHYWLSSLHEAAARTGDVVSSYPPGVRVHAKLQHQGAGESRFRTASQLRLVQLNNLGWRLGWNPIVELAVAGTDVFHCSQHTVNLPRRTTSTATIFDFSCWTTPERHTPENVAATRRYGEVILRRCDGLIAISAHARSDAMELLRIPGDRIRVIYPGVAEPFFDAGEEQALAVRSAYRLSTPYLLFVGCIEPRKNIPNVLLAYHRLRKSLKKDVTLVIAGPFGWEREDLQRTLTNAAPAVRYLGYVSEDDLPGLFHGASAFVFPSYYEGFGLPVAQAMAAGVPVVTSDRACLPEVVADAGMTVNPDSVEELTAAIERVLDDSHWARELARRGRLRAEHFRWRVSGGESLQFFHEVAGR